MKIPNNIEKMTWNIPTHDAYERTNEIIEAVNILLERARKEDVENTPFAMNSEETIKALDWVKADAVRNFAEWVIDKISEFGWIEFSSRQRGLDRV